MRGARCELIVDVATRIAKLVTSTPLIIMERLHSTMQLKIEYTNKTTSWSHSLHPKMRLQINGPQRKMQNGSEKSQVDSVFK